MKSFGKTFLPLFLILSSFLSMFFPVASYAYPAYTANTDPVIVGPYDTATSGTANWGITPNQANTSREFITIGQRYRIRQNGSISRIRLYTASTTNLSAFYFKVWRKDGTNYDLVGTSENLVGSLVGGSFATIDLATPISVQEGDYYGYRAETTGNGGNYFFAKSATSTTTYYMTNSSPSSNDHNWAANTAASGTVLPIEMYMSAPQAVFIGDSIIAGHPAHYSFLEASTATDIASAIPAKLNALTGYTYQNMGIGSQTTANISARFTADVINLKPKIVVLEGGVNDIAGSVSKSTFLANWTSMLDAAQASDSITSIIVLKILPWRSGTTVQMQTRDDWNASLATLASGYSKAIVVDTSTYVGEFRSGGDPGNLWNIQTIYNADGVHFNAAGHTQIAQAIADNLPKPAVTLANNFSTWDSGTVEVDYTLSQVGGGLNSNFSQTSTSGIEYSVDGSIWQDATKASGGDAITGLTSTSAGTDYQFNWDSSTDLPSTEDSSVFLRMRPNDGTISASSWVTSNSFGVDNVAPSSVSVPTFGTVTANSIEIIKPASASENGSGLNTWQVRKNSSDLLTSQNVSTNQITDTGILENTEYTYDVSMSDVAGNVSTYGTSATKYTLTNDPQNFSAIPSSTSAVLEVDTFNNDSLDLSGYYFSRVGSNSGWITTNSWTDTGLTCGSTYNYSVKYRNGEGVESNEETLTVNTSACASQNQSDTSVSTSTTLNWALNRKKNTVNTISLDSIKPGSKNAEVKKLQEFLNKNNFPVASQGPGSLGNETDYFGTLTSKALVKFQESQIKTNPKISQEIGIIGPITKDLITKSNASQSSNELNNNTKNIFTKNLSKGSQDSDVKHLQTLLARDKTIYPEGKITGFYGDLTVKAVLKFQIKHGIVSSSSEPGAGVVGPKTRAKLNEVFAN